MQKGFEVTAIVDLMDETGREVVIPKGTPGTIFAVRKNEEGKEYYIVDFCFQMGVSCRPEELRQDFPYLNKDY